MVKLFEAQRPFTSATKSLPTLGFVLIRFANPWAWICILLKTTAQIINSLNCWNSKDTTRRFGLADHKSEQKFSGIRQSREWKSILIMAIVAQTVCIWSTKTITTLLIVLNVTGNVIILFAKQNFDTEYICMLYE